MRVSFLITAMLMAPTGALAQAAPAKEGLDLSGSIRLRYETIDNQARAGVPRTEDLVNIRTILTARYRTGPLTIGAELFDSRVYDDRRPSAVSANEVNTFEPVQAYLALDLGDTLGKGTSLRVQAGRMLVNFGGRRLVANDDYRNTTNGFTGARIDIDAPGKVTATGFYLLPQVHLPDDTVGVTGNQVSLDREGFDARLWGFVAAKSNVIGGSAIDVGVYRFEERDRPGRPTRDRRLTSLSARVFRAVSPGHWDYEGEVIRQTGQINASTASGAATLPVEAWLAQGRIGYQWAGPWQPHLSASLDYASGNRPGSSYGRFDTLYGMRRAEFAPAGLYNALTRTNILTPGVRVDVTPSKRVDAFIAYRELWLASRFDGFATTGVIDPSGRSSRHAGRQIDARVRWWAIPKRLQLEADGVLLDKGAFFATAPNSPGTGTTAYLSLNATVFF